MTWKEFYNKSLSSVAYSDGSMGVFLQRYGLTGGDCPELWNVDKPDIVEGVHRSYVEAGADLVITNTLGGNRLKLADYGLASRLAELNRAGIAVARKAAAGRAIVAADVGPTGQFVAPLGNISFDKMVEIYREQIRVLAEAGADCIFFETHIDILELKAGIIACREVCDLPIIASVTFEKDGRMLTGTSPEAAFITLEALGVDMVGTNCGTGSADMLEVIRKVSGLVRIPIIAQANAGLPAMVDGRTVYSETPADYTAPVLEMVRLGVNCAGGCCGTTPEHIRTMVERTLSEKPWEGRKPAGKGLLHLTSRFEHHTIGRGLPFTVIGERLNPTARKALAADITEGAFRLFKSEAEEQVRAGAQVLDMNMGIPGADEVKNIIRGVEILSSAVRVPFAIDTANPEAAAAGMRHYPGRPLLNSITAEPDRLELLPLVKKYGAAFIALPIDEKGIPATADERVRVMRRIIDEAAKLGIDKSAILADPLVLTVSADPAAARVTIETVRRFTEELGLFTTMGLSNVSFGLPMRGYVNRAFMTLACGAGLTSAISNPFDLELMGAARAADLLLERDPNAARYVGHYAGMTQAVPTAEAMKAVKNNAAAMDKEPDTTGGKLERAVLKGDKEGIAALVNTALAEGLKANAILNDHLIPAITRVGDLYEKREYFLPQLMVSAETMKAAFAILEPLLAAAAEKPRGKVVMATVQGDVHDIGKNIVSLMLRNYGFQVTDLGKDVPAERIVEESVRLNADIIGLSALMTTTMPRMNDVRGMLEDKGIKKPVMVGGAAVTRVYAESIGAHYSRDAVDAVKLADSLMKEIRK